MPVRILKLGPHDSCRHMHSNRDYNVTVIGDSRCKTATKIVWPGREVSYFSRGRRVRPRAVDEGRVSPKTEIAFPHEPHITILCRASAFIADRAITAKVIQARIYATTKTNIS